jgi:hypothetical protein
MNTRTLWNNIEHAIETQDSCCGDYGHAKSVSVAARSRGSVSRRLGLPALVRGLTALRQRIE